MSLICIDSRTALGYMTRTILTSRMALPPTFRCYRYCRYPWQTTTLWSPRRGGPASKKCRDAPVRHSAVRVGFTGCFTAWAGLLYWLLFRGLHTPFLVVSQPLLLFTSHLSPTFFVLFVIFVYLDICCIGFLVFWGAYLGDCWTPSLLGLNADLP